MVPPAIRSATLSEQAYARGRLSPFSSTPAQTAKRYYSTIPYPQPHLRSHPSIHSLATPSTLATAKQQSSKAATKPRHIPATPRKTQQRPTQKRKREPSHETDHNKQTQPDTTSTRHQHASHRSTRLDAPCPHSGCSTQYSAVQCRALQCREMPYHAMPCRAVRAVQASTLQNRTGQDMAWHGMAWHRTHAYVVRMYIGISAYTVRISAYLHIHIYAYTQPRKPEMTRTPKETAFHTLSNSRAELVYRDARLLDCWTAKPLDHWTAGLLNR